MKKFISLLLILFTACSNGPDSSELKKQVEANLNNFQAELFKIEDFTRRGSYTYTKEGPHLLVYFKMSVELLKDYQFGNWNQLGANSLMSLLGATESGIQGIKPQGNNKGDKLIVYGSNNYKLEADKWVLTQPINQESKTIEGKKGFVSDIEAQENLEQGQRPKYQIHLDELKKLSVQLSKDTTEISELEAKMKDLIEQTQIKVDANKGFIGIATAESGGEYFQFGKTMEKVLSTKFSKFKSYATQGSLSNINYVHEKKILFGIAQGDMLADKSKQLGDLRAILSLFPEAIHVVALKSSSLNDIDDLKGKKVNLAQIGSGSHFHAKLLLSSHGMSSNSVVASYKPLNQALGELKQGDLDAVIFTGAYPYKPLLNFVKDTPIKLLRLSKSAIASLSNKQSISLTIPKNTYPNQGENILVAGTSAVMFTHKETSEDLVKNLLRGLFNKQQELAAIHKRASKFSIKNSTKGILMKMHPAASEFFGKK